MRLGQRIRALRLRRRLTVSELAKRTGYSPGLISQIEKNSTRPSIASIQKIAHALGASVSSFFNDQIPKRMVVRIVDRRKIVFPGRQGTMYLLSPSLSGHLQLIYGEIPPKAASGSEPHQHDSDEECALVLKGRMRFWVGEEMHVLREGDTITFESRIRHRWENIGRGKAVVLWAITPPSF